MSKDAEIERLRKKVDKLESLGNWQRFFLDFLSFKFKYLFMKAVSILFI